jgi:simple sugar transport system ATP-binding protein
MSSRTDTPVGEHRSPAVSKTEAAEALVEFRNITKEFGATRALRGVSFNVYPGETLGLLGANGAGKSTLIKILSGIHRPTSGQIIIEGRECSFSYPDDARNAGIATVHQNIDDGVVFGMSVAENLLLDEMATTAAPVFVTQTKILKRAREVARKLELELPLREPVESLSPSRRQEVAIARELAKNPKLLILDEPTSTLSEKEADKLFSAVADLQRRGISILYITHRMSEVEKLCDRAVVLRNGEIVSEHEKPMRKRDIASSILGELVVSARHKSREGAERAIRINGMRSKPDGPDIDLTLRSGEVMGLTGLIGAGKTEFLEQLCGHRPMISGSIEIMGEPYRPKDAMDAMAKGVVMVPEQRALQSIFPEESLWRHCTIGLLREFSRLGFMDRRKEVAFTDSVIAEYRVVAPGSWARIEELSGGNQQKLLVGRWLKQQWKLVVLDEPFRGIDIGARGLISKLLREYSETAPVLVCSSDPEEVVEVADRVLIMVEGRIVYEEKSESLTADGLAEIISSAGEGATPSRREAIAQ